MLGLTGKLNFARCRRRVTNMTIKVFHFLTGKSLTNMWQLRYPQWWCWRFKFSETLLTKVTSKMWRVLPHRGYLVVLNSLLSTSYACELFPHRTVSYLWYQKMLNVVIYMRPHKNQHFTHQISSLDCVCNIFKSAQSY